MSCQNSFEMELPEVRGFFSAISRLGEPFVTGFRTVEDVSTQWHTDAQWVVADLLAGRVEPSPVFEQHWITMSAPQGNHL